MRISPFYCAFRCYWCGYIINALWLICFIYPYPSWLLRRHCDNSMITLVHANEATMKDMSTYIHNHNKTQQSKTVWWFVKFMVFWDWWVSDMIPWFRNIATFICHFYMSLTSNLKHFLNWFKFCAKIFYIGTEPLRTKHGIVCYHARCWMTNINSFEVFTWFIIIYHPFRIH